MFKYLKNIQKLINTNNEAGPERGQETQQTQITNINDIYCIGYCGFGDLIKNISIINDLNLKNINISTTKCYNGLSLKNINNNPLQSGERPFILKCEELTRELDINVKINFINRNPTNCELLYNEFIKFNHRYVKTHKQYCKTNSNLICYQFDGNSYHKYKNHSDNETNKLINSFSDIKFLKLGKHLSIKECINYLSICKLFIGVDSGMSHLAHCVNTPCVLIKNRFNLKHIKKFHNNSKYTVINSLNDFNIDLL